MMKMKEQLSGLGQLDNAANQTKLNVRSNQVEF